MRWSIEKVLLLASMACLLCGLLAAPVWAQARADSEWGLIDLSAQVYAVPDVSPSVRLDAPAPRASAAPGLLWLMPSDYATSRREGLDWPSKNGVGLASSSEFGFAASSGVDSWSLDSRSWRYVSSSGFGVRLGNELSQAPVWGRPVRLAGIGVSAAPPRDQDPVGAWKYAMAVGALDDSASTATSGSLTYGPAAYDGSAEYALSPDLSLASRVQGMSDLFALGLGGEYSMSDWGSWAFGVSRAQQSLSDGWRYQVGYKAEVLTDLQLSWVNEQRGANYSDLSSYRPDGLGCGCIRNAWQLSAPMGRWGELSGTYERLDGAADGLQRTFGLAQRFWYSPHLQVHLEANSNIATGAYGLTAKFSLPLY